jgi:hypothetical protein
MVITSTFLLHHETLLVKGQLEDMMVRHVVDVVRDVTGAMPFTSSKNTAAVIGRFPSPLKVLDRFFLNPFFSVPSAPL